MAEVETHQRFLRMAISEAVTGVQRGHGTAFGAVIAKDGQVIAAGHNEHFKEHDPTAHGEITTIRKACKQLQSLDLTGCVLYSSCQPCSMCAVACMWAGIKTVYYAALATDAATHGDNYYNCYIAEENRGKLTQTYVEVDDWMLPFEAWKKQENKLVNWFGY